MKTIMAISNKRLIQRISVVTVLLSVTIASNAVDSPFYGRVTNAADSPIEGVLILLQNTVNNHSIAVSSGVDGHYAFPGSRLERGSYTLEIRATGFSLAPNTPRNVSINGQPKERKLTLVSLADKDKLASQLTSLEWLQSWPGSQQEKEALTHNLVNCMFCHSLERIARSTYDADQLLSVMQRMLTYETDHSSAQRIQIVAPPQPLDNLSWFGTDAKKIAAYLATVNLSNNRDQWPYEFKLLPRPAGAETQAIITVFPIPRANSVVHDLDVDQDGRVWFGNTGWDYLGMLDPRSGQFSEWEAPNFLPEAPAGTDRILGVQDIQVDAQGHVWAAVGGTKLARFLPKEEKWQAFDLPVIWRNPFLSPVREQDTGIWATGLAGPSNGDQRHETAYKLDIETGKLSQGINLFDHMPTPDDPYHSDPLNYCYMMDQDINGDFLCTAPVPSGIIRASLTTQKSVFYPTPTPHAYPRRGYRDDANRFWFSEFYADQIAVLDLNTNEFKEYPLTPKFISPYYARPDKQGYIWSSSTGSDRLLRLDPNTGEVLKFLMPVYYDARKVVVDESAGHTTIWLPSKNTAQLIRVELMNDPVSTH